MTLAEAEAFGPPLFNDAEMEDIATEGLDRVTCRNSIRLITPEARRASRNPEGLG